MSTERDQKFYELIVWRGEVGELSLLLTHDIVELQLLCDAELQERADYYPADDGGNACA